MLFQVRSYCQIKSSLGLWRRRIAHILQKEVEVLITLIRFYFNANFFGGFYLSNSQPSPSYHQETRATPSLIRIPYHSSPVKDTPPTPDHKTRYCISLFPVRLHYRKRLLPYFSLNPVAAPVFSAPVFSHSALCASLLKSC